MQFFSQFFKSSENKYWLKQSLKFRSMKPRRALTKIIFAIWKVRLILVTGTSDVLLQGTWRPVKPKIDLNKKRLTQKELYKMIASEEFKKLNLCRRTMNFMLMNSEEQNYTKMRIPSTISWTKCENYSVGLIICMTQRISRMQSQCTVDNLHTFPVIQRYFLTKMNEEICLAAPKLRRLIFGIRRLHRETFFQVHLLFLRHPTKRCPHHGTILIQEESPRGLVRDNL